MKTKVLILAGTFALILLCTTKAFSTSSLATPDKTISKELPDEAASASNFMKVFKAKFTKKIGKVKRIFTETGTKDPTKKWLWFWVGGWILGISTYIVSSLIATGAITFMTLGGFVGLIIVFLGSTSLKIWLFKKISQLSKAA